MNLDSIREALAANGQEHLLKYQNELDKNELDSFFKQLSSIDFSVLGALKNRGEEKRGTIAPQGAVTLDEIAANREKLTSIGENALKNGEIGAVLLAGGQGTRLGLDKPKGMLCIGETRELYLFEQLINNMLDVVKSVGKYFHLYIMTSDKNNADTVSFFEAHNFFGYDKAYVHFFIQELAPSVDYNGKIYLESKSKVSMSPNGNGGWFTSLAKAGLLPQLHEAGVKWLNIFSVDNPLQRICDPVFIGATIKSGFDSGSKVVSKTNANERVGVLCKEDGHPSIVEYYEMTDDMINLRDENGVLLYNYGVILNYLFKLDKLEAIMDKNMPVHVVEKKIPHIDENGNPVAPESPNGFKFETLVLDMIRMMNDCLSFEVEREREFAPIKNLHGVDSLDSSRELLRRNSVEL